MVTNKDTFYILAINPGSTSTKLALYENDKILAQETIRHNTQDFIDCDGVLGQKDIRKKHVLDMLERSGIMPESLSAVVGRGGLVKPIDSGTYRINDKMLGDLRSGSAATHASALGGIIAGEMSKSYNIPAFVVDPIVVDEMDSCAKLSGIPGIERRSVFHALNTKSVARICAKQMNINYEDGRFVVAHMGGGISVGAHRYGRVIDVNDALCGEGAFTPERCGTVPIYAIIDMCFSGAYTKDEMMEFLLGKGGMYAYLGTNDMQKVEKMIKQGDDYAALVLDSMAYQVAKEIGAMVAVLEGRVNAIILTGGLAHSTRFTGSLKTKVDQIAPVITFAGEDEMTALASGALRVLRGEQRESQYI